MKITIMMIRRRQNNNIERKQQEKKARERYRGSDRSLPFVFARLTRPHYRDDKCVRIVRV